MPAKLTEICPYCGGEGDYKKGWDLPQRRQKKGAKRGEYEKTGLVTPIYLYKCKKCQRNFRKAGKSKKV